VKYKSLSKLYHVFKKTFNDELVYNIMSNLEELLNKLQIKKLNEFQEKVFNTFLNTKDNILMVAPTGIGKTTIAELIMLSNTNGKSVYISPLRALSYQVFNELSNITQVRLATGDVYIDDNEVVDENIIMTTYEKFDSIIRRNYNWLEKVNLIFLDEIHNMRERKRSEPIELILQWALEKGIRIITASATVGQIEKIGEWLNAKIINADQRPVPLYEYILYGNKLISKDGKIMILKKNIINYIVEKGKNILIFQNTRKRAESEYDQLRAIYKDKVALFHGGLPKEERQKILQLIQSGKIQIVVSTTALGQGVNLPIYCVLFREMTLPQIENGRFMGWKLISVNEYKQIAGRAGRPRFDNEGVSIIEAKSEWESRKYIKFITSELEPITSYLKLDKFILAHLSRNEYESIDQIFNAIKYTFTLKTVSKEEIENTIEEMEEIEMIGEQYVDDDKYLYLLPFGRAVSFSYLDINDAKYYKQYIYDADEDILKIIAYSPKIKEISRNADVYDILREWILGDDPKDLVEYGENITINDVKNIISTATWQAYSYYSILNALNIKNKNNALYKWLEIQNGVPKNAINLVNLKGIGRKLALFLYKMGYNTKKEICGNIKSVIENMEKDDDMRKQIWRINELCKAKK